MEWMHEKFYDPGEAAAFAADKKGAEIEIKSGNPSVSSKGEPYYATPEDWPAWIVWWPTN